MREELEFDSFETQPFFGELEEEAPRRRGSTPRRHIPRYPFMKRKVPGARWAWAKSAARPFMKPPWKRWPPFGPKFPVRFPGVVGVGPAGPNVGQDPASTPTGSSPAQPSTGSSAAQPPNGSSAAQPSNCEPCVCPSCSDQTNVNQPGMDQPPADQPAANHAGPDQAGGDQPGVDQAPTDAKPSEFFYPQNGFGLRAEYNSWQRELDQSRAANAAAQASGNPRIIDLTAQVVKGQRRRMRDPKKVNTLVLHQMACCFYVKDPLKRFLEHFAPHFAILPDGRILQLHPIMALTGASNGFNSFSVAVEFAGNFPNSNGKWWIDKKDVAKLREKLKHLPEAQIRARIQAYIKSNQNQVTPQQIEAGRYLVRYLIQTMGLKMIVAHRQSSKDRENDPGPDVWYHVGQWAIDNLGLSDGGPSYKIGTGNTIPDIWRKWGQIKPQPELEFSDLSSEAIGGRLGEWESRRDPSLAAIAERIAARRPMRASAMKFEKGKSPRWSRCFKVADIDRVRKAYQDNTTAAGANSVDRCSCIVMLNVALGQLLKLKKKESRARDESSRKVQMGALTTETIEKAMEQLRRAGFARPATKIDFFDRRNKTAGTLKPERLKKSVQQAVLDLSTAKGCWYAYGLSIMDGYHSVLLLVDKTGDDAKIFWLDQFSTDINDDVTTTLDQRITTKTQDWWQAVMDSKNVGYDTPARIWPLRWKISS